MSCFYFFAFFLFCLSLYTEILRLQRSLTSKATSQPHQIFLPFSSEKKTKQTWRSFNHISFAHVDFLFLTLTFYTHQFLYINEDMFVRRVNNQVRICHRIVNIVFISLCIFLSFSLVFDILCVLSSSVASSQVTDALQMTLKAM